MLNLSFKTKLMSVVLITLAGISLLAYVSLSSLTTQNRAAQNVSALTAISDRLAQLQLDLLLAENQLAGLHSSNIEELSQTLKRVRISHHEYLKQQVSLLHDVTLVEQLQSVIQDVEQYTTNIELVSAARIRIGLTDSEGVIKQITAAAIELEQEFSGFSVMEKFREARKFEKDYINQPNQERKEKLYQQIDLFTLSLKEIELYDSFAPYIEAYVDTIKLLEVEAEQFQETSVALASIRQNFSHQVGVLGIFPSKKT